MKSNPPGPERSGLPLHHFSADSEAPSSGASAPPNSPEPAAFLSTLRVRTLRETLAHQQPQAAPPRAASPAPSLGESWQSDESGVGARMHPTVTHHRDRQMMSLLQREFRRQLAVAPGQAAPEDEVRPLPAEPSEAQLTGLPQTSQKGSPVRPSSKRSATSEDPLSDCATSPPQASPLKRQRPSAPRWIRSEPGSPGSSPDTPYGRSAPR